eukprot:8168840-Alexandrium_andersonii.AAC.1
MVNFEQRLRSADSVKPTRILYFGADPSFLEARRPRPRGRHRSHQGRGPEGNYVLHQRSGGLP